MPGKGGTLPNRGSKRYQSRPNAKLTEARITKVGRATGKRLRFV
jgi:hypothetical protein